MLTTFFLGATAAITGSERDSGPEGADDLCLVSFGDLGLKTGIWVSRLEFGPKGSYLGLKARLLASKLGFGPQRWDLGLKAGI